MKIDYEKLRSDLIDYFGTATFGGFPMAVIDLSDVETASPEKLITIAKRNGFDLREYEIDYPEQDVSDEYHIL